MKVHVGGCGGSNTRVIMKEVRLVQLRLRISEEFERLEIKVPVVSSSPVGGENRFNSFLRDWSKELRSERKEINSKV